MDTQTIISLIKAQLPDADVSVTGDGHHFDAVISAKEFAGKSKVQQQQMIYAILQSNILSGELHALSLKTQVKA